MLRRWIIALVDTAFIVLSIVAGGYLAWALWLVFTAQYGG
jgi:hypothetical protein